MMRVHWLQHVPFEGLGSIETWLRAQDAHVTATRLHAGDALPAVTDLDLVIAMGGPMSVNDDDRLPWLADERRFVRQAIERGVAVLGVCLGAQLIASALGARVYRNAEREIGWWPIVGASDADDVPSWARAGVSSAVFHWHGETFDLPEGSVPLAHSAGCVNQAFRIGRQVVGIQFHLETTPTLVEALVTHCPEDLASGPFVQPERELRACDAGEYMRIHQLMGETLDFLCPSSARPRAAIREDRSDAVR
jgi:GMP synthase-like glutamine amidotransferase